MAVYSILSPLLQSALLMHCVLTGPRRRRSRGREGLVTLPRRRPCIGHRQNIATPLGRITRRAANDFIHHMSAGYQRRPGRPSRRTTAVAAGEIPQPAAGWRIEQSWGILP